MVVDGIRGIDLIEDMCVYIVLNEINFWWMVDGGFLGCVLYYNC